MDICEFRPKEHGSFEWVHISPPCTIFSRALTSRPRALDLGDRLAEAALRLCEHYAEQGTVCTLENLHSGLMKSKEYMLPHADKMRVCDYCGYGYAYRKRTAFWAWNMPHWTARPLCRRDCPFSDGKTHTSGAARRLHEGRSARRQPPQPEPTLQHPGRTGHGAVRAH